MLSKANYCIFTYRSARKRWLVAQTAIDMNTIRESDNYMNVVNNHGYNKGTVQFTEQKMVCRFVAADFEIA